MKKISLFLLVLLCTGCQDHKDITNEIHVSLVNPREIKYINERGWFNDGYTYVVYSCEDITFLDNSWKALPMKSHLDLSSHKLSQIKHGYYYFKDRSPKECETLMNYILAVYDTDTQRIHYLKSDL